MNQSGWNYHELELISILTESLAYFYRKHWIAHKVLKTCFKLTPAKELQHSQQTQKKHANGSRLLWQMHDREQNEAQIVIYFQWKANLNNKR